MRGHTAVDGICEFEIIFAKGFDERGGVNAGGGSKRIAADDRIVRRNQSVRGLGDFLAVFLEAGKILLDEVHQAKVDEHQFHGRVAYTLAKSVSCRVNLVRAGSKCRERIGNGEAAIVVPVPVDANFLAGRFYDFVDRKLHKIEGAGRSGMADGVAKNDGARAVSNGRRV